MAKKKMTFEQNLDRLENIVKKLEDGNIPLDESLNDFKKGVALRNSLRVQLNNAENVVTKMKKDDGSTVPLPNNQTKAPAESSTKKSTENSTPKSNSSSESNQHAKQNSQSSKPTTSSATSTAPKKSSSASVSKSNITKSNANKSSSSSKSSKSSDNQANQAEDLFHQLDDKSNNNPKSGTSDDSIPF